MAKKPNISTVASGYQGTATINNNFQNIRDQFDNTLSRDGSTPNSMLADLDMNGYSILNVGASLGGGILTVDAADARYVNQTGDTMTGSLTTPAVYTNGLYINGNPVVPSTLTYNGIVKETKIATSGQTVFNLTSISYTPGINNLSVYVDGVYQRPANYTETNATRVTFSVGLHVGAIVDFVVLTINSLSGTADATNLTYTAPGTGANSRTIYSKLSESISVKDFGAVGDGVADDTVAIQEAIDYAGANHVELIVPEGTYLTSSTLYIDQDEFTLRGTGAISTTAGAVRGLTGDKTIGPVIQYTGTSCALQVSNSRSANPKLDAVNPGFIDNIQIYNLRIEVPANCAKGMLVFQASGSYFFNISIWGSQSTGGILAGTTLLSVQAGINNIFEKIDLLGVGRYTTAVPNYDYYVNYGAYLDLGWGNDLATTTIFRRCYFHYCQTGVNLSYIYQFEDCIFEACKIGVNALAGVTTSFVRCWWEANTSVDVAFNDTSASFFDCRLNSYSRQQFFTTGGGVKRLFFNNVYFGTTNANPFIFGTNPSGNNIFSPTVSEEIILFNNCKFPTNIQMGYIYNSSNENKIQISNMNEQSLLFTGTSIAASTTPTALTPLTGTGGYTAAREGHIVGYNLVGASSLSAGYCNITIRKNGSTIADLTTTNITSLPLSKGYTPFLAKFNRGDILTATIATDSAWSPTMNVNLELVVAFGPSGEN